MKKVITCLFLSILMFVSLTPVSATISVPERTSNTSWVEDYAHVLSESTERYIQEYSQKLADDYSACIVVVTVDFVTGSIQDYALAIFNRWKIGDASKQNGILLLLSIGDDDYYMMIGRGLEDSFPIYDIQLLLDQYLEPDFAAKDYDAGVLKVFKATYRYVNEEIYDYTPGNSTDYNTGSESRAYGVITIIIILFAIIMIIAILRSRRRTSRYYTPRTYYTRPRYRTYRTPYTYTPSHFNGYDRPSGGSGYHGGGGSSSHSSSSSSHSSGSGTSYGGSSRGAGAGRH